MPYPFQNFLRTGVNEIGTLQPWSMYGPSHSAATGRRIATEVAAEWAEHYRTLGDCFRQLSEAVIKFWATGAPADRVAEDRV